jgi:Tol biopolymer transport system component
VSPDGRWVAFTHSDPKDLATYVVDFDGRTEPRRVAHGGTLPTFSPDGSAIWAGSRRKPTRYGLATGAATRSLDSPDNSANPHLRELPDGRVVAAYPAANLAADNGIAVFSTTGEMTWLARVDAEEVLVLAPGGRHVLGARTTDAHNPELFAVPIDGGPTTALPTTDMQPSKGMSLSPDRTRLAWSACRGLWTLGRFDAKGTYAPVGSPSWQEPSAAPIASTGTMMAISERSGRAALWVLDPSGRMSARMVPGSDGRRLGENVDVSTDGTLAVVELVGHGLATVRIADGMVHELTQDSSDLHPMFTGDGRRLLFTRREAGGITRVYAIPTTGGEATPQLAVGSSDAAPSPVDARVAYLDCRDQGRCTPMLADTTTGRSHTLSSKLPEGRYMSVAFAPDGKHVAVVNGETGLTEVDTTSGAVVRTGDAGNMLQALRYGPDGLWAARAGDRGNVWIADVELSPGL